MSINLDAAAMEARYGNKTGGTVEPAPIQDLSRLRAGGELQPAGQIKDIPEGVVIQQAVGRGQPAMMVVPPGGSETPKGPQVSVVPPTGAGRTTIGTFVDAPQFGQIAQVQEVQPEPKPEPKKRKPLDLAQLMCDHIFELGGEKSEAAQEFYDRSPQTLTQWMRNPAAIPLGAIVKYLQRKPGVRTQLTEDLEPHFQANGSEIVSLPNRGKMDVLICTPVLERMTVPYATMLGVLCKKFELGFTFRGDTMLSRSRNFLAKKFLESGCQWSLWIDSDIAAPIGHRDWFQDVIRASMLPEEALQYEVLSRLLSHNKPIVGGVYASRQWHGKLVIQPEIHPRSHDDKLLCNDIRRGTARGLAAVDWVGFGLALIHREVFLEIQRTQQDIAPQNGESPWRFFQTAGDEGEDEAFCQRARQCGIPIWLDTQLVCGHIGNMAFLPEHTAAVMAM
jgi:hypothetical protein